MEWDMVDSSHVCKCGRDFQSPGALAFHVRYCAGKKHVVSAITDLARTRWNLMRAKKRRRNEDVPLACEGDTHVFNIQVRIYAKDNAFH